MLNLQSVPVVQSPLQSTADIVDPVRGKMTINISKGYRPPVQGQLEMLAQSKSYDVQCRLRQLVAKFLRGYDIDRSYHKLMSSEVSSYFPSDLTVYGRFVRNFPSRDVREDTGEGGGRALAMATPAADIIRRYTPKGYQLQRLLDVGCGDGAISAATGKALGIPHDSIDGIDVAEHPKSFISAFAYDGKAFPADVRVANAYDLITVNHTLHHVQDLAVTIAEIDHVLVPGGLLFIKEHNVENASDAMLVFVEHILYALRGEDHGDFDVRYLMNWRGWDAVFGGYEPLGGDWFYANARNPVPTPTRTFWRIYRKPTTAVSNTITVPAALVLDNATRTQIMQLTASSSSSASYGSSKPSYRNHRKPTGKSAADASTGSAASSSSSTASVTNAATQ